MTHSVVLNGINVCPDDPESMLAGWKSVEKLAGQICNNFMKTNGLRKGMTMEDIMQEAYITYDHVIRTYDSEKLDIIGYLYGSIVNELKLSQQVNGKTQALEECISIDKAHYDDYGDKVKEAEYIPGGNSRDEAEEHLEAEELSVALQKAIGKLSSADKATLQAIKNGEKVPAASKRQALRAARLAILNADDDTKEIIRAYAPYI